MVHSSRVWLLVGSVSFLLTAHCSKDSLLGLPDVCSVSKDCDDGNPCTLEECVQREECRNIPVEDGQRCDNAGLFICVEGRCGESLCGDGFIDVNFGEECDDGGTVNGDGCAADCTNLSPSVVISYPERGGTLEGARRVTILGEVRDPGVGVESLRVNGEVVAINRDGTFSHAVDAVHGLNFSEAIVRSLGGKEHRTTVGFYHSSAYLPYAEEEAATHPLNDGLVYRLGQEAFDDGDHPCQTVDGVYQCDEVDDLATVGEIILNNLDSEDLGDSMTFFERRYPFLAEDLTLDDVPPQDVGIGDLTIAGEIGFDGEVIVKSEVVELDFNDLDLSLRARPNGLDATVAVHPGDGLPGFNITVRTSVSVMVEARFNYVSAVLDMGGFRVDSIDLICAFLPPGPGFNTICPNTANGPLAPLAGFDPNPSVWADSGVSVAQMTLETGFNITTDSDGEVQVMLTNGNLELHDSWVDLDAIRDIQVDLGDLSILGGVAVIDLGRIDLHSIAEGLDEGLDVFSDFILQDLQNVLEGAINILLLNPFDVLNVGDSVKTLLMNMELDQELALEPYSRAREVGPVLRYRSTLESLHFAAPEGDNLNTGGMTAGFDTTISAARGTYREPLGMVLRDRCYRRDFEDLGFTETQPMEAAEHLDFLNQGLYGVWWDGGFNMILTPEDAAMTLPEESGITNYTLALDFYAAPTFTSCGAGTPRLQVADVKVHGVYFKDRVEHTISGFANFSLPVAWGYDEGRVTFETLNTDDRFFHFEPVSGSGVNVEAVGFEAALEEAVADQLVLGYVAHILSMYPVLSFDLGEMYGLETGATLEMSPALYYHSGGYEVIGGSTEGPLP